jgi:hypothetical protein
MGHHRYWSARYLNKHQNSSLLRYVLNISSLLNLTLKYLPSNLNLKDAMENAVAEELGNTKDPIVTELQQQLVALQRTLDANAASWASERSAFVASLETQVRARASAEEDRDFFRAQYSQASAFVSSVRAENTELEERVAVAEGRAVDGVALVRATFTERVKQLEGEVSKFKATARLLMEQDRRTGEDIRRRAGEEPGLRARCEVLGRRVEVLGYKKRVLEVRLAELEQEKENWMCEVEVKNQLGFGDEEQEEQRAKGEMEMDSKPGSVMETKMVHRCHWRTDVGACASYFSNIEVCVLFILCFIKVLSM